MSILVRRPSKFILRDLEENEAYELLGKRVMATIRQGGVFVATPDDLDSHEVVVGLREPPPPPYRPQEPRARGSILPWLTAAVL